MANTRYDKLAQKISGLGLEWEPNAALDALRDGAELGSRKDAF